MNLVSSPPSRRKYEGVVILHPDASEDDQKVLFKKNQDIVQKFEGEVFHLDTWGKRKLANAIHKMPMGIYFHTTFEANGDAIAELERTMKINDRVLRFLHTRLDDRTSLAKYLETFKNHLAETARREKEREERFKARKSAHQGRRTSH